MEKRPSRDRSRPYFCSDVNIEYHLLKKEFKGRVQFKSIYEVTKNSELRDSKIIKECDKKGLHIITHNTNHFKTPPISTRIGIICIGPVKDKNVWLSKFESLINKYSKHKDYFYKNFLIGDNFIEETNRKTGKTKFF